MLVTKYQEDSMCDRPSATPQRPAEIYISEADEQLLTTTSIHMTDPIVLNIAQTTSCKVPLLHTLRINSNKH